MGIMLGANGAPLRTGIRGSIEAGKTALNR
jgi:hypothetical protein